jgi:quinol monooxygenase YgiN
MSHRACEEILSMTEISTGGDLVTYINVFTVAPENQQRLIELLQYMAREVMPKQPGYVQANIHRGLEGTRVANYNQWRSQADLAAAREDADVRACMEQVLEIATLDLVPYEVVSVHRP